MASVSGSQSISVFRDLGRLRKLEDKVVDVIDRKNGATFSRKIIPVAYSLVLMSAAAKYFCYFSDDCPADHNRTLMAVAVSALVIAFLFLKPLQESIEVKREFDAHRNIIAAGRDDLAQATQDRLEDMLARKSLFHYVLQVD